MPYVERDANGSVTGCYANAQPGYAEEWLEPDDPEVVAFLNPPAPPYILPISVFWVRMSDSEAEEFDEAISVASPLRLRRAFNSASSMISKSEIFLFVLGVLLDVTSEHRASEIMAPSLDGVSSILQQA